MSFYDYTFGLCIPPLAKAYIRIIFYGFMKTIL
jgi:hypothetical protein